MKLRAHENRVHSLVVGKSVSRQTTVKIVMNRCISTQIEWSNNETTKKSTKSQRESTISFVCFLANSTLHLVTFEFQWLFIFIHQSSSHNIQTALCICNRISTAFNSIAIICMHSSQLLASFVLCVYCYIAHPQLVLLCQSDVSCFAQCSSSFVMQFLIRS